ncbi:hypothetical protein [Aliidiomarina quisquiliarum]|uniref:hypothetical protein n=1 Tax=Aliidiomarina quisquiliarum TaxID=2938947 RepID=UPI00208F51CF|nr:hypothetical protein [Aliidiomarina quisquiliarum]MCO4319992.1 hypothetical protein [Aliidiomarina quisquiliarum]
MKALKLTLALTAVIALAGCDAQIYNEEAQEIKQLLIECSANPRIFSSCSKLFEPNVLEKNKHGDLVFVPGIKLNSLDYASAKKDAMLIAWRATCQSGCGGFNEFDEWWGSF